MKFDLSCTSFSNREITDTIQTIKQVSSQIGCHFFYCKLKKINQLVTWKDRLSIRKDLINQLKKHYKKHNIFDSQKKQELDKLLNLNWNPKNSTLSVSIAHCPVLAGFVCLLDQKISIGFDIELANRVTDRVVQRVSQLEELKKAPSKDLLWTAKEATCKCIGNNYNKEPILFKDCLISEWQKTNQAGLFSFSFKWKSSLNQVEKTGMGSAFLKGCLVFGYAQTSLS